MTADERIKSGSTFVRWAVAIAVLVHYFVLPRLSPEQRELNRVAREDISKLQEGRGRLLADIAALNLRCARRYRSVTDRDGAPIFGGFDRIGECNALLSALNDLRAFASEEAQKEASPLALSAAEFLKASELVPAELEQLSRSVRANESAILESDKNLVAMMQARIERQLRIPGMDVGVSEADVRRFYALALVIALALLLNHRHRLFDAFDAEPMKRRQAPFWSAPLPSDWNELTILQWFTRNAIGLSMIAVAGSLFIEFSRRDEFYLSESLTLVSVIIAVCVFGYYVAAIVAASRS